MIQNYVKLRIFFVAVVAVLVGFYYPQLFPQITTKIKAHLYGKDETQDGERLFTKNELAKYNGQNGMPLYLALLGSVYDVTRGEKHYGPGCSYNYFIGRDASVAFITGAFENFDEDAASDVLSLKSSDLLQLANWNEFYRKDYIYKGKLVGRFYNRNGEPTTYHHKYLEQLEQAKTNAKATEQLRVQYPDCNIEWSAETGSRVWCTRSSGGKVRDWSGYPRKVFTVGSNTFRCACIREEELKQPKTKEIMIKSYDNCDAKSYECFYNVDD